MRLWKTMLGLHRERQRWYPRKGRGTIAPDTRETVRLLAGFLAARLRDARWGGAVC